MSSFSSDKCSKEELNIFKMDVIDWLNSNFPNWNNKFKLRAYTCYNGDIRLYDGDYMEVTNNKSSFRRTEQIHNEDGIITGWNGLRGHHTTRIANYITINRDEFNDIKSVLARCDVKSDEYFWWDDLLFSKLI